MACLGIRRPQINVSATTTSLFNALSLQSTHHSLSVPSPSRPFLTHKRCIYYYTPLPLILANKQQASTSPFRFGYCFASSLLALLYSSHSRA